MKQVVLLTKIINDGNDGYVREINNKRKDNNDKMVMMTM